MVYKDGGRKRTRLQLPAGRGAETPGPGFPEGSGEAPSLFSQAGRHPSLFFLPPAASTTAFVGQCFVDEAGAETLETTWLLRKEVPSRDLDWQATL